MNIPQPLLTRIAKSCAVSAFLLLSLNSIGATPAHVCISLIDSVRHNGKVREVLTSQQLFLVEATPIKGPKAKKGDVNFKAELRDAFMVILYAKDTSSTELDWVMCPNGKCPIAKTYNQGTPEYTQLDTWITNARKNNIMLTKRLNSLKSGKKGAKFSQ